MGQCYIGFICRQDVVFAGNPVDIICLTLILGINDKIVKYQFADPYFYYEKVIYVHVLENGNKAF